MGFVGPLKTKRFLLMTLTPILPMQKATHISSKTNFICKIVYLYLYGFLIDLGQFHYYSSTNPLRTEGPNECNPPVSGFLMHLLGHPGFSPHS